MRIIVIGATGTIGTAVVNLLSQDHTVVKVGNKSGDFQVDIARKESIEQLFNDVGTFDTLVCAAGLAKFGPMVELSDADFQLGLSNKLMGQVNLVRLGTRYVNDYGSIVLTSGILAQHPMPGSVSISMINAGIEGFVRAAAMEMERGVRLNAVSPPWVKETLIAMGKESSQGMPADKVALAYQACIERELSGKILYARDFE
ncbi:short chain dehydrogenase [Geomesophilobacter sediminis]|uniref:Short chain dehydrogenase n=1 Tax=Geomesophilobacter sediminis TaxID=2798584 RepID=A0A8J7M061_9BACT|nr:short chain dehydrogenase [Geomesophilobacter sediminis]MBJ6723507.1 short chain dehydrogenase [Geomesophilobacter sediminis]